MTNLTCTNLAANTIKALLTNYFERTRLVTPSTDKHYSLPPGTCYSQNSLACLACLSLNKHGNLFVFTAFKILSYKCVHFFSLQDTCQIQITSSWSSTACYTRYTPWTLKLWCKLPHEHCSRTRLLHWSCLAWPVNWWILSWSVFHWELGGRLITSQSCRGGWKIFCL